MEVYLYRKYGGQKARMIIEGGGAVHAFFTALNVNPEILDIDTIDQMIYDIQDGRPDVAMSIVNNKAWYSMIKRTVSS